VTETYRRTTTSWLIGNVLKKTIVSLSFAAIGRFSETSAQSIANQHRWDGNEFVHAVPSRFFQGPRLFAVAQRASALVMDKK
jgi:hypothetical protein